MGRIRVIVADGWESSAEPSGLLSAVLEREGVEIVGEVFTVPELIELAADEQPDAVVFATRAPQADLERLRSVAPDSKIVFVSPILIAAEAEMAEAVVERADVLASLGPVLVHLCMPGRINARRGLTESFDRPDWIDRVRKDPVTLREILSEAPQEPDANRPNVTSLQGEARAADLPPPILGEDEVVRLPDLEGEATTKRAELEAMTRTHDSPPPVVIPPARGRRRRRGLWSMALITLGGVAFAVLPSTIPVAIVAAPPGGAIPLPAGGGEATSDPGSDRGPTPERDTRDPDADTASTDRRSGHDASAGAGAGANAPQAAPGNGNGPGGGSPAGGGQPGGGTGGDAGDMPGSSAEHNPHGGPPGQTGDHPEHPVH